MKGTVKGILTVKVDSLQINCNTGGKEEYPCGPVNKESPVVPQLAQAKVLGLCHMRVCMKNIART